MAINTASGSGGTHIRESVKYTPEQIRNFLASSEMDEFATGDMISMDETYHRWLQPKYVEERKAWNEKMRKDKYER
jgi:hypothetical protein